ncbi:alpha/beta hydrolase [Streptomyces canus]|uniref:alpha/beta hydrolase n=1 Tax=Streptomyces canus TaxID=58343 RepID=UPI0036CC80A7
MRTVKATAAAVTAALTAAAAGIVAGRIASDAGLKAPPGRPLPGDPRLTVHSTAAGPAGRHVALTRHLAALRPGTYGLVGDDVHAVVGDVLTAEPHSADTVVRRLERVTHGTLAPGDKVWLTPNVHVGDPKSALGLDHTDVGIPGELGVLPAWFVPGRRDTWVIAVHGLGATREHTLNIMEFLHRHRFPVLVPTLRGDAGAPRPPDGLNHFGETEWRDLDAAMRYALANGARQLVLHGWSTGATMALRAAAHSGLRDRVRGLVLDSPVLSWELTLRALAAARHTPGVLLPLAVRAAQGRTGLPSDHYGLYADRTVPYDAPYEGPEVRTGDTGPDRPPPPPPTLILHGPDDTIAPWDLSRRLAGAHPDRIALHTVRQAPHAAMWNADPSAYEEALRRFLTPLM